MTITVKFDPRYSASGSTSQISWQNPDVMPALRKMFRAFDHEVISGIELTDHGITARFARKEPG